MTTMTGEHLWLAVGLTGQLLFTARFLVQWLSSEKQGRSVMPVAFWYLSLSGGLVLFTYAIHRADPVFVIGQSMGLFIYLRNLHMVRRETRNAATDVRHEETPIVIRLPFADSSDSVPSAEFDVSGTPLRHAS